MSRTFIHVASDPMPLVQEISVYQVGGVWFQHVVDLPRSTDRLLMLLENQMMDEDAIDEGRVAP